MRWKAELAIRSHNWGDLIDEYKTVAEHEIKRGHLKDAKRETVKLAEKDSRFSRADWEKDRTWHVDGDSYVRFNTFWDGEGKVYHHRLRVTPVDDLA